jgi:demethylmenaquinone methyltransferase/2-methoxy-6-polyprenyl-1,4-benzoquinol methylase
VTVETGRLGPEGVRRMFDRIAPVYDLMNRVMTVGLDGRWRKLTAAAAVRPGDRVLDGCCGTGDLAVADKAAGAREVIGLDFSEEMLVRARRKDADVAWIRGDLLQLPFAPEEFDAATVGFGIRNVDDLDAGLRELRRVLKPGGRVAILEITQPRARGPISTVLVVFYRLWFDALVPLLGKVLPGGSAYTYLPASVRRFPGPEELARRLATAGFGEVGFRRLGGGIVALHTGVAR